MRSIRRFSQVILTVGGGALVVYAVSQVGPLQERVLYTSLGLLIMELGIWQVTALLFPNEREFRPLRVETDYFLKLVRRLNRAAVAAEGGSANALAEIERVHEDMHHSVERMRRLAGQTQEAIPEGATKIRYEEPLQRGATKRRSFVALFRSAVSWRSFVALFRGASWYRSAVS